MFKSLLVKIHLYLVQVQQIQQQQQQEIVIKMILMNPTDEQAKNFFKVFSEAKKTNTNKSGEENTSPLASNESMFQISIIILEEYFIFI